MTFFDLLSGPAGAVLLVALLLAGGLALVRARSAGLALHREIAETQRRIDEVRGRLDSLREAVTAGEQMHERTHGALTELLQLRDLARDTNLRAVQMQAFLHELDTRQQAAAEDVKGLYRAVGDITGFVTRRPARALPVDTRALEQFGDAELAVLAESISMVRPLVPYPKWVFDADWHNPDLGFQLRRWFWQRFSGPGRERPVTVPWHYGTRLRLFLGNDVSAQIYIAGCLEPNEFAFLDRILRPGMTFLDAGANEGAYTVFAAARTGPQGTVWAFEPSPREAERLRYNLELNGLAARVFTVALSDFHGEAQFTISQAEHSGHNTLGAIANPGVDVEQTITVEARPLDEIVEKEGLARVDVLKIDVEGAELQLLQGAEETLRKCRPVILFEASEAALRNQGASREDLLLLLRRQGYRLYAFERASGVPVPANGVFSDNLVALPEEMPMPSEASWPLPRV